MRVAPESESRVHTELFPKSTFYRHLRRAGPFIFAVVIISAVIAVGAVTIDRLSEAASKQTAESRLKDLEETIANLFQQSLISTNQQMHGYASGICELIDASRNGEEVSARAVRDVYKTMQRSAGGNERQQRHFPETMCSLFARHLNVRRYAVAVRPWERAGFESWASLAFDQPMNISTPKMVNGQVRGFMPAPETPSNSLDLHFPILFVGEENAPPFALKQGYLVDMVSFGPSSSTSQSWIETVRTGHAAYFVLRALVSTGYKARGTRVVWPLYNCSNPFYVPDTEEERVAQIIGMAGRSVYTDSLLADVFAQHDILQPGSEEHEYVSASMSIQNVTIYSSHDDPFQNVVLSYSSNFLLDNTTEFQVTLEASQGFVEQYRPDSRWLLTAICLVATLVGIFVFGVSSLWLNHATSVEERQQKGIQQRLDTLHELIYTTSHDLRTPIMAIRGAISMLEPQLPKNTPAESSTKGSWTPLELAISATKLLELFVENLQDTAKIQQGGLDLQSQSVDLVHEFSTLVSLVKATGLLQQETSLSFECSERTPQDTRVLCDRGRVVRVVMNLVSNACKFTRTGTIKVFMDMSRSTAPVAHEVQPEWQVRISVSDTGVGMDGPMLERAMKPFVRAAAKEGGGTGLGLHICNETARAYNGTMTMDSPGKGLGSTVTVNLRLQQAPAEPPPTVMPVEETPSRSSANADLSVLIVEDNFVVSKVLQAMLNRLGVVNVELAGDGGVAQRLLETTDRGYDCCFMDDSMPVMCGTDLIRSVRKWEHSNRAARLPTCLLTGSLLDSRTTVTDEAFDYLITKPPSLSSLKAFLQTARDLRGGHRSQNPTPPNPPSSGTLPPVRRFRAPE